MKLYVQAVCLHLRICARSASHLCMKLPKCAHEIVLCAAWVGIHSAADYSNVLVPLEILFICLCKVADKGTMLQHLAGNPEMTSQKSEITPSHQRSTTCQASDFIHKLLEVSLGFSQKARCLFFSSEKREQGPAASH